jgi:hypothetical protein
MRTRRLSAVVLSTALALGPVSWAADAGSDNQILLRPKALIAPDPMVEQWKQECATKKKLSACYNVAVDYAQSHGDEAKAVEYLRPLCKKKYVLGCFNLGGILVKEVATRKEGLAAFRKACALSEANAGTPKENAATEGACSIADVVANHMNDDYDEIAVDLGYPPRPPSPIPPGGSKAVESSDLTGRYKVAGGSVKLLQGGDELWLVYDAGFHLDHSCGCVSQAKRQEDGSWQMTGDLVGKIEVTPAEIVVSTPTENECCGAGWQGVGRVLKRPVPLQRCVVKAPKLPFLTADQRPTKAYLVAGDKVDAVVERDYLDVTYAIARFVGKTKTTIGLLDLEGLECSGK